MTKKIVEIAIGDVVEMKKEHPCGVNRWEVYRTGMEIGLICLGCKRKIKLERAKFNARFKKYLDRGNKSRD